MNSYGQNDMLKWFSNFYGNRIGLSNDVIFKADKKNRVPSLYLLHLWSAKKFAMASVDKFPEQNRMELSVASVKLALAISGSQRS